MTRTKTFICAFLVIACIASVAALFLESRLREYTLTVSPSTFPTVELYNDSLYGGSSVVKRIQNKSSYEWECELVLQDFGYPYCGFEIFLGENRSAGIDLSGYSRLRVHMNYEGEARTTRLILLNFNAAYSNTADKTSTKFNLIELDRLSYVDGLADVSMDSFTVAPWWLQQNEIPESQMGTEFSNLVIIEIQTGSEQKRGTHHFDVEKIVFVGEYFSRETGLIILLMFWQLVALAIALGLWKGFI